MAQQNDSDILFPSFTNPDTKASQSDSNSAHYSLNDDFVISGQTAARALSAMPWQESTFVSSSDFNLYHYHTSSEDVDLGPCPADIGSFTHMPLARFTRDARDQPWSAGARFQQCYVPSAYGDEQHYTGYMIPDSLPEHDELRRRHTTSDAVDSGYSSFNPQGASDTQFDSNMCSIQLHDSGTVATTSSRPSGALRRTSSSAYAASDCPSRSTAAGGSTRRKSSAPVRACPYANCNKIPKNRSDATKHAKTHEKPYKCRLSTCPKSEEGFGTPNDRARHELCKHKINISNGPTKGYICQACQSNGHHGQSKWWPRLDNFKAHIKRKHELLNEEVLVRSSERDSRPDDTMSDIDTVLSGGQSNYLAASHPDSDLHYQYESVLSQQNSMAPFMRQMSQQGENSIWPEGPDLDPTMEELAGESRADVSILFVRPHDISPHRSGGVDKSALPALRTATTTTHINPRSFNTDLRKRIALEHCDAALGTRQPRHAEQCNDNIHVTQHDRKRQRGPDGQVVKQRDRLLCERCPQHLGDSHGARAFDRKCDMSKHARRHERPYGCTHPRCYDKSGSKSDWLRHETKVHGLPEAWLCMVPDQDGSECRTYHRDRGYFKRHLESEVHCLPSDKVDIALVKMHLGRKGLHRFWCGFCNLVIENPTEPGADTYAIRNQHVGKHMDKSGGCDIRNWICPEAQNRKGSITLDEKSRLRNQPLPQSPLEASAGPLTDDCEGLKLLLADLESWN